MHILTEERKLDALEILESYTRQLHDSKSISVTQFEHALRAIWGMGYQEVKDVMIDIVKNHKEYVHLAAYYMENSNPAGVVVEFQQPLAELYGLRSWYYDENKEEKRKEFWENAFALISQFDVDAEIEGVSILQVSSKITDKLIERFLNNPEELRTMNPRLFEELIAELFQGFGYNVELTQATRDGGFDIIAVGNNQIVTSKFLIECKRYSESSRVGVQPARSLYGVVQSEGATKGILVTTSTFTRPAQVFFQRNEWKLEGRDFDGVLAWLRHYQTIRN